MLELYDEMCYKYARQMWHERDGAMPNYKKMYQVLLRATESATNILIAAQRECEDLYINAPETELKFAPHPDKEK